MRRILKFLLCLCIACSATTTFAQDTEEEDSGTSSPFSQAKFVPDISFILDASAVYRSIGDNAYEELKIPGYRDSYSYQGPSHAELNQNVGFNFNYGELALFAAVDPYFELFGVFCFTLEHIHVEEAYISTMSLPGGLGIKAGKFLSGFGRIIGQHAHYWDFADQPLVIKSIFGEGLCEIGAQIEWVAPSNIYFKIGAEVLQGENEASFGKESFHDPGYIYRVKGVKGPNLYTGFIKSSFDIGNATVFYGGSGIYGNTRKYRSITDVEFDDLEVEDWGSLGYGMRARTWVVAGELTLKYMIDSYRYITLQGEYLYRSMRGHYYYVAAIDRTYKFPIWKQQSGLYTQLVVKPLRWFRAGARFDLMNINRVRLAWHNRNKPNNLFRVSGMIDFHPSEFSLFRLQYNYDRSAYNALDRRRTNHEAIIQMNIAIGAHGAHSF